MATESVTTEKSNLPHEDALRELRNNNWVCDYETHRVLWGAQSICRMLSERMQDDGRLEVEHFAIEGVERLLCSVIERTGWSPAGHVAKEA